MKKETLIFDFDGTLGDSFFLVAQALNTYAKWFKYKPIKTQEEIEMLRGMSPLDIIDYLGVSYWKIPFLAFGFKYFVARRKHLIQLFPGIKEMLGYYVDQGKEIYILSSNRKSTIRHLMIKNDCDQYIKKIIGGSSLFGKQKGLKKLLVGEKLNKKDAVYIGDEIRDVTACKDIDLDIVAVGWGYSSSEALKKVCTHVVHSVEELKQEVI